MREIKVRAWYKPYKQMCQVESLRFDGNGVYRAVLIEEPFYDRRLVEADEIVIEQYTGLKDKNDKDIYEGDILALYHRDGSIVNLCQVFWNELDNEYDWKPVGEDSWSDLFSAFYDDYKVVGNVHECTFN